MLDISVVLSKICLAVASELAKKSVNYCLENSGDITNNYSELNKKITSELTHILKVRTIWGKGKTTNINEIYYPAKLSNMSITDMFVQHAEDKENEINIEELITHKNVVVQGIVGQGKSFFLRHLAIETFKSSKKIPIFIELMRISDNNSIINEIEKSLDRLDIKINKNAPPNKKYNVLENFIIFLDGFDEINSKNIPQSIQDIELITRLDTTSVIITSRPNSQIVNLATFKSFSIKKLTNEDYSGFMRNLRDIEDDTRDILTKRLNTITNELKSVVSTPLMLTLFIMVYLTETSIPENISEFYDKLFNTVLSRHDNLKPGFKRERSCKIPDSKLLEFFEAFSFISKKDGYKRTLNTNQFIEVFNKTRKTTGIDINDENHFKNDIANGTNLMLDDGFDLIAYTHKSLQEYYSATFIKKLNDQAARKFYESASIDYLEWLEVINYLSEIDRTRYSKFFAITQIEAQINLISCISKIKDEKLRKNELISYLNDRMPDWNLIFESHDGYSIESFGAVSGSFKSTQLGGFKHFSLKTLELPVLEHFNPRRMTIEKPTKTMQQKPATQRKKLKLDEYNREFNIKLTPNTDNGKFECKLSILLSRATDETISELISKIIMTLKSVLKSHRIIVDLDEGKLELFDI